MKEETIKKLLNIDTFRLDETKRYYAGEGFFDINVRSENKEIFLLSTIFSFMFLIISANITTENIFASVLLILVSVGFGITLASLLISSGEWLHNNVSKRLTWSYMRNRLNTHDINHNNLINDISIYLEEIEGKDGFIWMFNGCFNRLDSKLSHEDIEDLMLASMENFDAININDYLIAIKELIHYFNRTPTREKYKEIFHAAG